MAGLLRACLLLAAAVAPMAAQATVYAVVPLVGSQLAVVTAEPVTSTNIDRNTYQYLPFTDDVFDRAMRQAVDRAVRARRPEDSTLLVQASLPTTGESPLPDDLATHVIEAVGPKAMAAGAERLVVIAPYRAAPMLNTEHGHIGSGRVAGIGIYVNRFERLAIAGTRQSTWGFLGLFANFRVLIVDSRTGAILAEDVGTVGTTLSAARAQDSDPMNTLTTEQKVARLQGLLRNELARLLPSLLEKAGP
jgi:hypothetical protein